MIPSQESCGLYTTQQ